MATTTRFDNNIIVVARRLKDKRLDTVPPLSSSDTGLRYSNALLSSYENRAIRDLILDRYAKGTALLEIPEYIATVASLAPNTTTGILAKSDAQWHFVELISTSPAVIFIPLAEDAQPLRVVSGRHGIINPTYRMPIFYEESGNLVVYPATSDGTTQWSLTGRYLKTHQDITIDTGAVDVAVNSEFDSEIQERMFKMAIDDAITVMPPRAQVGT